MAYQAALLETKDELNMNEQFLRQPGTKKCTTNTYWQNGKCSKISNTILSVA